MVCMCEGGRQQQQGRDSNMRVFVIASAVVGMGLGIWACGEGNGYGSGNSGNPTTPTASAPGVVTINVVAVNGAQSFSPNPATLPAGQLVVWHNIDTITHRVVLDDRSLDTGDLGPGASSQPMPIAAASGQYHCSIHPVMVGSVNQDTNKQVDPCQGPYCN
jgi:plastocyanin